MAGYKLFVDTEYLTVPDVNGYLVLQTEMRFASVTARDNALPSSVLTEGLTVYTTGDDVRWMYDGSAWQPWDNTIWKVWTPTINNFTLGNGTNAYRYKYLAGDLEVKGKTTLGSTSSVDGTLTIDLPNSETSNSAVFSQGALAHLGVSPSAAGVSLTRVKPSSSTIELRGDVDEEETVWDATFPITWATGDYWVLDLKVAL